MNTGRSKKNILSLGGTKKLNLEYPKYIYPGGYYGSIQHTDVETRNTPVCDIHIEQWKGIL